jgi:hypothetical protein
MPDTEANRLARREAEKRTAAEKRRREERLVDLVSEASFPASDAPPWTFGRPRSRRHGDRATPDGSPGETG